jgi:hypothetical protein
MKECVSVAPGLIVLSYPAICLPVHHALAAPAFGKVYWREVAFLLVNFGS